MVAGDRAETRYNNTCRNRWKIRTFPEPQSSYSTVASYYSVTTALIIQLHEYSLEKLCDESYSEKWPRALTLTCLVYTHTAHIRCGRRVYYEKCAGYLFFQTEELLYTQQLRERKEKTCTVRIVRIRARCEPRHCRGAGAGMCGGMSSSPGNSTTRGEKSHSREQGRQICFETEVLYTSKTPKRDE